MRQGTKPLAIVIGTAVTFAVMGFGAGQFIRSPDEVARDTAAPPPSVITAKVERRVLANQVVVRGDVAPSTSVEIKADPSGGGGESQVITGRVPKEGARLRNGDVAIEVSGRPVFLLAGRHPVYRALRPGSEGPDVKQLEQNLSALGFAPGPVDGRYDSATEAAVAAFYKKHGYDAPEPTAEEEERLSGALDSVKQARTALRNAQNALQAAKKKTQALKAAVKDAEDTLAEAEKRASELGSEIGIWIPRAELSFVKALPMTVTEVKAKTGEAPTGVLMVLAGGSSHISVDIAPQYRAQVKVGGTVKVDDAATGLEAEGTITSVASKPGTGGAAPGLIRVRIRPGGALAGNGRTTNVRVTIPIKSTGGPVLTVPETALYTRADGTVHLRVLKNGEPTETTVRTGLVADGLVEVTGDVSEGDEVVVGEK